MNGPAGALALWLLAVVSLAASSHAHPPSILGAPQEKAVAEEIIAFRKTVAGAIAARNRVKLLELYAPRFTHIDPSGKTSPRDAHIDALMVGASAIETAEAENIQVHLPNDWVAVVTGSSRLSAKTRSVGFDVAWMAVYSRTEIGWALVASQATRIEAKRR